MSLIILMGKTASGKDTIQRELADTYGYEQLMLSTDRPMRPGEEYGVQYNFRTSNELDKMIANGKMIECRAYEVVNKSGYGCKPGQYKPLDLKNHMIMIWILKTKNMLQCCRRQQ